MLTLFVYSQDAGKEETPQATPQSQENKAPLQLTPEERAAGEKLRLELSLEKLFSLRDSRKTVVNNYSARFNYTEGGGYKTYRAYGEVFVSGTDESGKLIWIERSSLRDAEEKKIYINGNQLITLNLISREATKYDITQKSSYFLQIPLRSGFIPDLLTGFKVEDIRFAMESTNKSEDDNGSSVIEDNIPRQPLDEVKKNPSKIYNPGLYHRVTLTTDDEKLKRIIRMIEIWVNKENFLIEHIELIQPNGATKVIDLTEIRVNTEIPAEAFAVSLEDFRVK